MTTTAALAAAIPAAPNSPVHKVSSLLSLGGGDAAGGNRILLIRTPSLEEASSEEDLIPSSSCSSSSSGDGGGDVPSRGRTTAREDHHLLLSGGSTSDEGTSEDSTNDAAATAAHTAGTLPGTSNHSVSSSSSSSGNSNHDPHDPSSYGPNYDYNNDTGFRHYPNRGKGRRMPSKSSMKLSSSSSDDGTAGSSNAGAASSSGYQPSAAQSSDSPALEGILKDYVYNENNVLVPRAQWEDQKQQQENQDSASKSSKHLGRSRSRSRDKKKQSSSAGSRDDNTEASRSSFERRRRRRRNNAAIAAAANSAMGMAPAVATKGVTLGSGGGGGLDSGSNHSIGKGDTILSVSTRTFSHKPFQDDSDSDDLDERPSAASTSKRPTTIVTTSPTTTTGGANTAANGTSSHRRRPRIAVATSSEDTDDSSYNDDTDDGSLNLQELVMGLNSTHPAPPEENQQTSPLEHSPADTNSHEKEDTDQKDEQEPVSFAFHRRSSASSSNNSEPDMSPTNPMKWDPTPPTMPNPQDDSASTVHTTTSLRSMVSTGGARDTGKETLSSNRHRKDNVESSDHDTEQDGMLRSSREKQSQENRRNGTNAALDASYNLDSMRWSDHGDDNEVENEHVEDAEEDLNVNAENMRKDDMDRYDSDYTEEEVTEEEEEEEEVLEEPIEKQQIFIGKEQFFEESFEELVLEELVLEDEVISVEEEIPENEEYEDDEVVFEEEVLNDEIPQQEHNQENEFANKAENVNALNDTHEDIEEEIRTSNKQSIDACNSDHSSSSNSTCSCSSNNRCATIESPTETAHHSTSDETATIEERQKQANAPAVTTQSSDFPSLASPTAINGEAAPNRSDNESSCSASSSKSNSDSEPDVSLPHQKPQSIVSSHDTEPSSSKNKVGRNTKAVKNNVAEPPKSKYVDEKTFLSKNAGEDQHSRKENEKPKRQEPTSEHDGDDTDSSSSSSSTSSSSSSSSSSSDSEDSVDNGDTRASSTTGRKSKPVSILRSSKGTSSTTNTPENSNMPTAKKVEVKTSQNTTHGETKSKMKVVGSRHSNSAQPTTGATQADEVMAGANNSKNNNSSELFASASTGDGWSIPKSTATPNSLFDDTTANGKHDLETLYDDTEGGSTLSNDTLDTNYGVEKQDAKKAKQGKKPKKTEPSSQPHVAKKQPRATVNKNEGSSGEWKFDLSAMERVAEQAERKAADISKTVNVTVADSEEINSAAQNSITTSADDFDALQQEIDQVAQNYKDAGRGGEARFTKSPVRAPAERSVEVPKSPIKNPEGTKNIEQRKLLDNFKQRKLERQARLEKAKERIRIKEAEEKKKLAAQKRADRNKLKAKSHVSADEGGPRSEDQRRRLAYHWYTRCGMPSKKSMKERIQRIKGIEITEADIDLLPWMKGDYMVNVSAISKLMRVSK